MNSKIINLIPFESLCETGKNNREMLIYVTFFTPIYYLTQQSKYMPTLTMTKKNIMPCVKENDLQQKVKFFTNLEKMYKRVLNLLIKLMNPS